MSDLDDDDALAAEYVVGTLDRAERETAAARGRNDPNFARLVQDWNARLAPLIETIPAVEPDAALRAKVLAEVDRLRAMVPRPVPADNVIRLRRELVRWRLATALSAAAAIILALWGTSTRWSRPAGPTSYLAVLQRDGQAPAFLVTLDLVKGQMTILPSDAQGQPDRSLELWMIGSDAAGPHSLGLLDSANPVRMPLPDATPDLISRATYAVTLEPKGGSPTGRPTSAPIYVGKLIAEPK